MSHFWVAVLCVLTPVVFVAIAVSLAAIVTAANLRPAAQAEQATRALTKVP